MKSFSLPKMNLKNALTKLSKKKLIFSNMTSKFKQKNLKFATLYLRSYSSGLDRETKLIDMFNSFSDSGKIKKEDFFNLIKSTDSNASDKLATNILKLADDDKDGYIEFDEFKTLFEPLDNDRLNMKELVQYWSRNTTISDPVAIFENVWHRVVQNAGGLENIYLPREILFLAGAPGAGKGTQTNFVLSQRGITSTPVVMSSLLKSVKNKKKIIYLFILQLFSSCF